MNDENDIMYHVPKDDRYARMSAHDLKVMRANMIEQGAWEGNYQAALIQFWIMQKENRLPRELG